MTRHRHTCGHVHDCPAPAPAVPPGSAESCEEVARLGHVLSRVEALVTEHPESEVPLVSLPDLRRALGGESA